MENDGVKTEGDEAKIESEEVKIESHEDETDAFNLFSSFRKKETVKEVINESLAPPPHAETYKMNHSRRGTAIIFNHVNFSVEQCSKRDGSDKDRDDLNELFHELNFDVLIHNDLTAREIQSVLLTVSQMDHSDSDCLVVVMMSHGDNEILYARDREYPTKILWRYFNARNCPTLAGKPKLFFIQACRGEGLHRNHILQYQANGVEEDGDNDAAFYTIPVMADILVMYSTVEGFYSWRDPTKGSYFIQSLVKQLRRYHKDRDLLTILTFVNREVAVDFESYNPRDRLMNGNKQMCSIVSMLTRLLYFTKDCVR